MQPTRENGFTLVELLVAIAIASIVLAAVVSAYFVQVRGKNTQEVLTDMNDASRAALEIMVNEIRMAGFDPEDTAVAGFLVALSDEVRFTMDIGNGATYLSDGDTTDSNEDVHYRINTLNALGRQTNGAGGFQPLVPNVDALDFVYFDGNGNILATPVTGNNLDNIRSIEVTIVARAEDALTGAHTDNTVYQNQQGQTIFTAPGDHLRRFRLTTTVTCRNMTGI